MQAYRVETTLTQDGTLTLRNLPFRAGEAVEVIILVPPPVALGLPHSHSIHCVACHSI